jgi:hypothetical protein
MDEHLISDLKHLPRMLWTEWMKALSTFKYGIHLMPTIAAGTFSLNCAYLGIPCIGNENVDTQRILFPKLSVNVENLAKARELAKRLNNDQSFYAECVEYAKEQYHKEYTREVWVDRMNKILSGL